MGKLSDKYTAEEPQALKSLNDEYGDTDNVETLLNISYLIDILSNPTYNSLEVGFRHTPLSDREKIERYKDACEHAVDVLTRMFESMKGSKND